MHTYIFTPRGCCCALFCSGEPVKLGEPHPPPRSSGFCCARRTRRRGKEGVWRGGGVCVWGEEPYGPFAELSDTDRVLPPLLSLSPPSLTLRCSRLVIAALLILSLSFCYCHHLISAFFPAESLTSSLPPPPPPPPSLSSLSPCPRPPPACPATQQPRPSLTAPHTPPNPKNQSNVSCWEAGESPRGIRGAPPPNLRDSRGLAGSAFACRRRQYRGTLR